MRKGQDRLRVLMGAEGGKDLRRRAVFDRKGEERAEDHVGGGVARLGFNVDLAPRLRAEPLGQGQRRIAHAGDLLQATRQVAERGAFAGDFQQVGVPMLVVLGEKDFRIPYTQGLAAYTALQTMKVPGELLVFPDENHWVLKGKNSLQWHQTVFRWLDRWLRKGGKEG